MIETAERLAGLTDTELVDLHTRIDTHGPADVMIVEAHHLVTTEMLKRGMEHGHEGDSWADAAIVVDEVAVSGPDDIDAPEGFEKAFQDSLAGGGSVRVMLTVDGYVLKADPTVSDVHVDTIMPGRRRRGVEKAEWKVGDFASWDSSGGTARGKIERIMAEGVLQVPDTSFSIRAEDDDPAVLLRIWRKGPDGWRATDTLVGHKSSTLSRIEPLAKAASFSVPEDVQAAARQALKWIADGRAGDGFTSVGRGRARQLADGGSVSRDVLVKMRAYFARHIVDKDAEGWGDKSDPTPGMVAWYAWGGDPGRAWANRMLGDVEKRAIPAAITDLHLNVENRQHAIDEYLYGPMNPDVPGDYWQRLGDVWGVSAEEAATTRCGNCAAFNMTSEIRTAIGEAIGEGGMAVVEAADLGYCELLSFKCAADRSCSVWLTGGPISDDSEVDDGGEEAFLASLTDVEKEWYGQVAVVLDSGGDPDFVMQKAGNPEALRDYWRGGGKGKISWGAGGDFTACVAAVGKYMTSEQAKGYCAIRHREVTGMWPGDKRNRETKKSVGTALPEVPQPTVNVTYNIAPAGDSGTWTQVLKHPGHADQKVHGGKGGSQGTSLSREGKALIKGNLSRGNLVESYGASYDQGKVARQFGKEHVDRVVADRVAKRDELISRYGGQPRSMQTENAAFAVASHQGFIDGATGARAMYAGSHSFGETVAGFFTGGLSGAMKSVDEDLEPVVKHPGHPDQKIHGRRGGASAPSATPTGAGEYGGYTLGSPSNPPGEPDKRRPDSIAAAKAQREKVAAAEPEITRDMIDTANRHGAKMEGLGFRLKSEKSLARKIEDERDDPEFGGDPVKTADAMSDVARYTMTFRDSSYVQGARDVVDDLESQGYQLRVKNYWQPGDPYQGINIAAVHPETGVKFELQLHTPTSLDFKEPRVEADDPIKRQGAHVLYEIYRESGSMRTRVSLYRSMQRQAAQVPVPPPRDELLAFGTPKFQPLTSPSGEVFQLP